MADRAPLCVVAQIMDLKHAYLLGRARAHIRGVKEGKIKCKPGCGDVIVIDGGCKVFRSVCATCVLPRRTCAVHAAFHP
jgi:hypothetical protein